jgi:hypothetical protein
MQKIEDKSWYVKESVSNTRQNGEHINIDMQMDKKDVMYVNSL